MDADDSASKNPSPTPSDPHFQAVFNDPNVLMALISPAGRIQQVNRAALELVTPSLSDLIGTPFWEGPWWNHSQRVQEDMRRRVERAAAGGYVEFETDYVTGNNEQRLTAGVLRPVIEDDEVVSIIVSGRDTTDHVNQEQRLQVFKRVLRHNFRNKLTVIEGHADTLRDRSESPDTSEDAAATETPAQIVKKECEELRSSVEKVLQAEQQIPNPYEQNHIETLFTHVIDEVEDEFPNCSIECDAPDAAIEVPAQLAVPITEAVRNALEHGSDADPAVELTADVVGEREPSSVKITVVDEGPGIPPSESQPILDGDETALSHGSGIGLWLMKWIVEQYGGDLSISTVSDRGTEVSLRCPL